MNIRPAFLLLSLAASLLATSCDGQSPLSSSAVSDPPAGQAIVGSSPSYQTLLKGAFAYASIPRITAEELKLRLDHGEDIVVIDNRSHWKFSMGHLPAATNISYAIDSPFPGAEEEMDLKLAALSDDALKVFYCD
jgi:hypothetical protein